MSGVDGAAPKTASDAGHYRPVARWDRPAIVNHSGTLYPCRLVGTLVGRYTADNGSEGNDLGDRTWAAEALGLPAALKGEVTVIVSGGASVTAHVQDGCIAGNGVPWLSDGET